MRTNSKPNFAASNLQRSHIWPKNTFYKTLRLLKTSWKPHSTNVFCPLQQSHIGSKNTIWKASKGFERHLKANFCNSLPPPPFTGVTSVQKIHFIRQLGLLRTNLRPNFWKFWQPTAFTAYTSDQKVHFIKTFKAFESRMKVKFYKFCSRHPPMDSYLTQKFKFKVIQSYWEVIENQLLIFLRIPPFNVVRWDQKTHFTRNITLLRSDWRPNYTNFWPPLPFTGVTSGQKVHFIRHLVLLRTNLKPNFKRQLQPPTFNGVISDQKIPFIRHLRLLKTSWKPNFTNLCCPHPWMESHWT